jgi:hypothetical protein
MNCIASRSGPTIIWDDSGWLSSQSQAPTQFKHLRLFREYTASISSKHAIRAAGGGTLELAIAMMECRHLNGNPHHGEGWSPCYIFGDREAELSEPPGPDPLEPTSNFPGLKIIGIRSSERGMFLPKTGYAANFGLFKMCWYMISQTPSAKTEIRGRDPEDVGVWKQVGTKINGDPYFATQILIEATRGYQSASTPPWDMSMPGGSADNFWAGQRGGGSGLHNHDYGKEPDPKKPAPLPQSTWDDIRQYYLKAKYIQWMCNQDPNVWNTTVRYGSPLKPI